IGAQLDDYKQDVDAKRAKADDVMTALAEARSVSTRGRDGTFPDGKYAETMAVLAKYKDDDPAIQGAYEQLLRSYGPYTDPVSGENFRTTATDHKDQNQGLSPKEWNEVMDQLKRSLESLNSDNELTMMKLQTLMQQRNQITQFASNMLNVLHENNKAVIGNIRV
ncbi:MAG TPA: hypothetical protein VK524_15175, partial [Polyangiaceae bacterium]|nr:hypothetical protein [Polyangiaceae bacterium]